MREYANRIRCHNIECQKWHTMDGLFCGWRCEHIVEARMARNLAARNRPPAARPQGSPAAPAAIFSGGGPS